ncbi:unnamed protein product, partial [marine sediment metagenome]
YYVTDEDLCEKLQAYINEHAPDSWAVSPSD